MSGYAGLKSVLESTDDPAAYAVESLRVDTPQIGELTDRERTLMEIAWIHGKRYGIDAAKDRAIEAVRRWM